MREALSRWVLAGVAVLLGAAMVASAFLGSGLPQGAGAPEFTLPRHEGGTVSLESLRGKVVMLGFWASWCAPCVEELPALVRLAKEFEPRGVAFLAVNQDDPELARRRVEPFVQRTVPGLGPYVVYPDAALARRYQVQALPTLYFLGRDGTVRSSHAGYAPEDVWRARLEKALAAPPSP